MLRGYKFDSQAADAIPFTPIITSFRFRKTTRQKY